MNWEMVAALVAAFASLCGIATTIICVSFWSGRMTNEIANNSSRIVEHAIKLKEHDETFVAHAQRMTDAEIDIGKLNEWKNGYNAAAAIAQNRDHTSGQ